MKKNPFAEPRQPQNQTEWQVAADCANHLLLLDIARRFELLDEDGKPNTKRCESVLAQARDRFAITPRTIGPAQV